MRGQRLEFLLTPAKRRLRPLLLGHIPADARDRHDLPGSIAHGEQRHRDLDRPAVARLAFDFEAVNRRPAGGFVEGGERGREGFPPRRHELQRAANHFVVRITEHALGAAVPAIDDALGRHAHNAIAR